MSPRPWKVDVQENNLDRAKLLDARGSEIFDRFSRTLSTSDASMIVICVNAMYERHLRKLTAVEEALSEMVKKLKETE